jgi:hypothetical protein
MRCTTSILTRGVVGFFQPHATKLMITAGEQRVVSTAVEVDPRPSHNPEKSFHLRMLEKRGKAITAAKRRAAESRENLERELWYEHDSMKP